MRYLATALLSVFMTASPSVLQAESLSFDSALDAYDSLSCGDVDADGLLADQLDLDSVFASACAKYTTTVFGVSIEYCSGTCTNPRLTCQPTYKPDGSIRRCSCKPPAPAPIR